MKAAGLAMVEAARFWLPPCWSHKLSTVLVKVKIDVLVNEVVVSVDVTVLHWVSNCSRAKIVIRTLRW